MKKTRMKTDSPRQVPKQRLSDILTSRALLHADVDYRAGNALQLVDALGG